MSMNSAPCRICGQPLRADFVDLGMIPLCQSFTEEAALARGETFFPLRAGLCTDCAYVGLTTGLPEEDIFTEYAYFSSVSESWLAYVRASVASLIEELRLDASSQVVEMASNDGYLLQYFVERGIPALGVEPAVNVARAANERGVPTVAKFFNAATASELKAAGRSADLLLSYNSLDHCPDPNDVVAGMRLLLAPGGIVQVEVPYLRSMIENNQFDTIYHDRFSYFSLLALNVLFERNGLRLFDAQRIPSHGGSLRIRACHADDSTRPTQPSVAAQIADERACGMDGVPYYARFTAMTAQTKHNLLDLLIRLKREGRAVVGYGAPAKGNVLLNYCGIRADFLDYLVDRNPYKRGKFAPGTRLPVHAVATVGQTRPDFLLILPWNIKEEVMAQMAFIREWGGRFIVAIPEVEVL
jgi:SAM-dependent methyltransferase